MKCFFITSGPDLLSCVKTSSLHVYIVHLNTDLYVYQYIVTLHYLTEYNLILITLCIQKTPTSVFFKQ